jgi:hypothetical protein
MELDTDIGMSTDDPSDEIDLKTKREWKEEVARVAEAMQEYTNKFVTPISRVFRDECGEHGELVGTGTYVEFQARRFLLTNEHVAEALRANSLAHQFLDNDTVFRLTNPFHVWPLPLDAALSAIDDKVWNDQAHNSAPIPESCWALGHEPVPREILFFKGYSGEQSNFRFGHLITKATSCGAQEAPLPAGDPRLHFALDYRPDRATPIGENNPGLPVPKGFSGSVVWNTRFVECRAKGEEWSVESAAVTGLIWGWPSSAACVVGTRAEFVRSFLLRAIGAV